MSLLRSVRASVVMLGVVLAAGCSTTQPAATSSVTSIAVSERSTAGDSVEVSVGVDGDGTVSLEIVDAYVRTKLSADAASGSDGVVTFEIPGPITQSTGLLTLTASGATGESMAAAIMIDPAPLSDPLEVVVGPRTVVADGADETMAVVFATDRFGNPLPDGSGLDLRLVDEQGETTVLDVIVDGGVAGRRIGSGTVAQSVDVFATDATDSAGAIASRRVDFDEVPGVGVDVVVSVVGTTPSADGRSIVALRTSTIADRFDNVVPDGRLVSLRTNGPDGIAQLSARTISGVASFSMSAPSRAGVVVVTPVVDGVVGSGVEIEFATAVTDLPVDIDAAAARVSIGPVLDAVGAVVVDGTLAEVRLVHDDVVVWRGDVQLIDGRGVVDADIDVVETGVDVADVEVLGERREIRWPL
ncbi:MAG: hypothetical protein AB8G26_02665 [Ilumatobacter sp.]